MPLPSEVNILGKTYPITYVDNPAEVDPLKRKSLWGHIDYWTRTIRVYVNEMPVEEVWHTLIHEILHAIASELHIKKLQEKDEEDIVDLLALALTDVLIRNDWLKMESDRGHKTNPTQS